MVNETGFVPKELTVYLNLFSNELGFFKSCYFFRLEEGEERLLYTVVKIHTKSYPTTFSPERPV